MSVKEVKTSINGLEIGMFVSRLDRPWIETPFLMEGVQIQSKEDIENLSKYCTYVYVDLEQGPSPKTRYWAVGNENELSLETDELSSEDIFNQQNEYEQYRQVVYETTVELKEELKTANVIYDDIEDKTKKIFEDLKSKKKLDLVALKTGIKAAVDSIIRNPSAMSLLVQLRKTDDYNYSHALGTSIWCAQFGRHLGLSKVDINKLALGGMLLDVGKLEMPEQLIMKPGQYDEHDKEEIKRHVSLGVNLLKGSANIERVILEMVATHHERADGSGYQLGITNEEIPLFGRIAGIVDSYDAMTSKRNFLNHTYTPHEAMNELYHLRGKEFQAELVEQFIQTVGLYPTGSLVELNTGEVAVVTEINDLKRLYPTIMLLLDKNKVPYNEFSTIDLTKVTGVKVVKGLEAGAYGIKMDELFL